jgi:hypothetical protein
MARLTADEWAELRAEWEASPRQGLRWLILKGGGRWDIDEEPVRKRRMREGWAKRTSDADMARSAREGADRLSEADPPDSAAAGAEGPPGEGAIVGDVGDAAQKSAAPDFGVRPDPVAAADAAGLDLRTRLIDRHRREWDAARAGVYATMKIAEKAQGFERAKFAKIVTEALRNIQEGERKAWGLDADLIDYEALTDEQLRQVAAGKLPR